MYQTRVHQWGLDKKLKEHEARAIIHMLARQRGKATRMRLRDLPVDIDKAYSHFRRKGITIDEVLDSDAASLPELVCETPAVSPRPVPQDLTPTVSADNIIPELQDLMVMAGPQDLGSPRAFRIVEMLFVDAREYLLRSTNLGYGHNRSKKHFYDVGALVKVYHTTLKAWFLFDRHGEVRARDLVLYGFLDFETTVEDMSCEAILMMIHSIATFLERQQKQKSMALLLCGQLYATATNSKSRGDPIISVFGRMFSRIGLLLHNDDAPDYLLTVVHVFIDSLKTILGPVQEQTVFAAVVLSRVTRSLYGPKGLLGPLETLRSSLEKQPGWGRVQSAMVTVETAALNVACGDYQTARNIVKQFDIFQRESEVANIRGIERIRVFFEWHDGEGSVISEDR